MGNGCGKKKKDKELRSSFKSIPWHEQDFVPDTGESGSEKETSKRASSKDSEGERRSSQPKPRQNSSYSYSSLSKLKPLKKASVKSSKSKPPSSTPRSKTSKDESRKPRSNLTKSTPQKPRKSSSRKTGSLRTSVTLSKNPSDTTVALSSVTPSSRKSSSLKYTSKTSSISLSAKTSHETLETETRKASLKPSAFSSAPESTVTSSSKSHKKLPSSRRTSVPKNTSEIYSPRKSTREKTGSQSSGTEIARKYSHSKPAQSKLSTRISPKEYYMQRVKEGKIPHGHLPRMPDNLAEAGQNYDYWIPSSPESSDKRHSSGKSSPQKSKQSKLSTRISPKEYYKQMVKEGKIPHGHLPRMPDNLAEAGQNYDYWIPSSPESSDTEKRLSSGKTSPQKSKQSKLSSRISPKEYYSQRVKEGKIPHGKLPRMPDDLAEAGQSTDYWIPSSAESSNRSSSRYSGSHRTSVSSSVQTHFSRQTRATEDSSDLNANDSSPLSQNFSYKSSPKLTSPKSRRRKGSPASPMPSSETLVVLLPQKSVKTSKSSRKSESLKHSHVTLSEGQSSKSVSTKSRSRKSSAKSISKKSSSTRRISASDSPSSRNSSRASAVSFTRSSRKLKTTDSNGNAKKKRRSKKRRLAPSRVASTFGAMGGYDDRSSTGFDHPSVYARLKFENTPSCGQRSSCPCPATRQKSECTEEIKTDYCCPLSQMHSNPTTCNCRDNDEFPFT